MLVDREAVLRTLASVAPGLDSRRGEVEQSSCFTFVGGKVHTFNDQISCSIPSNVDIEGAVKAKPLLSLLERFKDDQLDILCVGSEVLFKGRHTRAGLFKEESIALPYNEVEAPSEWRELPADFLDALGVVKYCCTKDDSIFAYTCVHMCPDRLEACDGFQMTAYPIEVPIKEPLLVRAESINKLVGMDCNEISETEAWVHFRSPRGLIYSVRRHVEEYVDLSAIIKKRGTKADFPPGLIEALETAEIFTAEQLLNNYVQIKLREDKLELTGIGVSGWYKERKKVTYSGPELKFQINPRVLRDIMKRTTEFEVTEGFLILRTDKYVYVGSLGKVKEDE